MRTLATFLTLRKPVNRVGTSYWPSEAASDGHAMTKQGQLDRLLTPTCPCCHSPLTAVMRKHGPTFICRCEE